jgi:uncharacterized protein YidB (DUF937 family)
MGLLDEVFKGVAGKVLGGGGQNPLLGLVFNMISNPQTGGLQGLVQNFKNKGLDQIVSSWVSTGKNLPVSTDQIQHVLGSDQIQQMAKSLGASREDVSGGLASLLPEIIDKLTPQGNLPQGDALDQGLSGLKKQLLGL